MSNTHFTDITRFSVTYEYNGEEFTEQFATREEVQDFLWAEPVELVDFSDNRGEFHYDRNWFISPEEDCFWVEF